MDYSKYPMSCIHRVCLGLTSEQIFFWSPTPTLMPFTVSSVTRLGDFWKFSVTIKVALTFVDILGYFEVCQFLRKDPLGFFLGYCWKIWVTYNSNVWSHWWSQLSWSLSPANSMQLTIYRFDELTRSKGSFTLAVCGFRSRLSQCRDRKFSICLWKHTCPVRKTQTAASSLNEPLT